MYLLIPVELHRPWELDAQQQPRRCFSDIEGIATPRFLIGLKCFTILVEMLFVICGKYEEQTPTFLFAIIAWFYWEIISLFILYIPGKYKSKEDFTSWVTVGGIVVSLKWIAILFGIGRFVLAETLPWFPLAVFVPYVVIEVIMFRRYHNYYKEEINNLEDGLIEDLKKKFGSEHKLGEAVTGKLGRISNGIEDVFWEGVPVSSRRATVPFELFCRRKVDKEIEYFVEWNQYARMYSICKQNYIRMVELNAKCNERRSDMDRQNQLIRQCRQKMIGYEADCSDIDEVPSKTATYASWDQQRADGILASSQDFFTLYVKMEDYRELAQYAALVSKSIPLLEREKVLLKEGLKKRRAISDILMVTILTGNFANEGNHVLMRINDVD